MADLVNTRRIRLAPGSGLLATLAGSASGAQTALPLSMHGVVISELQAVPVATPMIAVALAVSWQSASAPATWTATLKRRRAGTFTWETVATAPVQTTP